MTINAKLVAHRGWQNRYPENTAIGIEQAISAGAMHVEIDIQLTADHIPWLCHDTELQRLSNSSLNINCINSEQVKELSAYEPQRLGSRFIKTPYCSLEECSSIIARHPNVTLYAEIKTESLKVFGTQCCVHAILKHLKTIIDQCIIISFDISVLEAVKAAGFNRCGPVLSNWEQAFSQQIKNLDPEILFCDSELLDHTRLPSDLPYPVAIYEIPNATQAQKLLEQGASLIETFCIGEIIAEVT